MRPPLNPSAQWTHSLVYRSPHLCNAYMLAAVKRAVAFRTPEKDANMPKDKASQKIAGLAYFFHSLPNLAKEPIFKIKAGAVESALYATKLRSIRNDIFPPTNAKEGDKYIDYIPIMWTIHNSVRKAFVPPVHIWDLSVISMFIFLVDEYMEGYVSQLNREELSDLRTAIENIFA